MEGEQKWPGWRNIKDKDGRNACWYFLGTSGCRNGDSCIYSHDKEFVEEWRDGRKVWRNKSNKQKRLQHNKEKKVDELLSDPAIKEVGILDVVNKGGCQFYNHYFLRNEAVEPDEDK